MKDISFNEDIKPDMIQKLLDAPSRLTRQEAK